VHGFDICRSQHAVQREIFLLSTRNGGYSAGVMAPATPSSSDPLRPIGGPHQPASRNAALQRRAMQAAIANAVRALRTQDGRRPRAPGSFGQPADGPR
jgi:hypothetical protein